MRRAGDNRVALRRFFAYFCTVVLFVPVMPLDNLLHTSVVLFLGIGPFVQAFLPIRHGSNDNIQTIKTVGSFPSFYRSSNHLTLVRLRSHKTTFSNIDAESENAELMLQNYITGNYFTKSHSLTVCIVPPPSQPQGSVLCFDEEEEEEEEGIHRNQVQSQEPSAVGYDSIAGDDDSVWDTVTNMRVALRDPGLYRWPPHVNLLYPFVRNDPKGPTNDNSLPVTDANGCHIPVSTAPILAKLRRAARQVEPFWVSLDLSIPSNSSTTTDISSAQTRSGFGTFGGPTRGVLWVYPESFRIGSNNSIKNKNENDVEPIVQLQSLLEAEFPMCSESLKDRNFLPHMTLSSKFDSLEDAKAAKATLAAASKAQLELANTTRFQWKMKGTKLSFWCKEFYLMGRDGENGQFKKKATIQLGIGSNSPTALATESSVLNVTTRSLQGVVFHQPPRRFEGMPVSQEDWVRSELEALKARRKINRGSRRRGGGSSRKSYRARKRARKKAANEYRKRDTPEEIARKREERKARREGRLNETPTNN